MCLPNINTEVLHPMCMNMRRPFMVLLVAMLREGSAIIEKWSETTEKNTATIMIHEIPAE